MSPPQSPQANRAKTAPADQLRVNPPLPETPTKPAPFAPPVTSPAAQLSLKSVKSVFAPLFSPTKPPTLAFPSTSGGGPTHNHGGSTKIAKITHQAADPVAASYNFAGRPNSAQIAAEDLSGDDSDIVIAANVRLFHAQIIQSQISAALYYSKQPDIVVAHPIDEKPAHRITFALKNPREREIALADGIESGVAVPNFSSASRRY